MEPISLLLTILVGLIILAIIFYIVKMLGFSPTVQNIIMLVVLLIFVLYLVRPMGIF